MEAAGRGGAETVRGRGGQAALPAPAGVPRLQVTHTMSYKCNVLLTASDCIKLLPLCRVAKYLVPGLASPRPPLCQVPAPQEAEDWRARVPPGSPGPEQATTKGLVRSLGSGVWCKTCV